MKVETILRSTDNTGKISIRLDDNSVIECVLLIDQTGRSTACVSSQVGCAQDCKFCKTGNLGLKRNLTTDEIINQFIFLKEVFETQITNIVYMGMGEPLQNIENVMESIRIFTNPNKFNIFLRRITVSTSGYIQGIPNLISKEPYPGLAFSLISANQDLRKRLMPNSPDLISIKNSLIDYQNISKKRIIIEIINFEGINETEEEAEEIKKYLEGLDVIINLIPFNSIGESEFEEPKMERVKLFSNYLFNSGLKVTIRHGKGQDISSACGQLGEL